MSVALLFVFVEVNIVQQTTALTLAELNCKGSCDSLWGAHLWYYPPDGRMMASALPPSSPATIPDHCSHTLNHI